MLNNFNNITYTDAIEIFFLSASIYYFLLWLKKDKEKNLILPFYGYLSLFFMSYYTDLKVISTTMIIFAPILLILFVILHQETLQKNFIMLKKIKRKNEEATNWQEELIQSCLFALNKNKEIVFILEKDDNLEALLQTQFKFYADFKKDLFEIILEKQICSNSYMIWLNKSGKLVAINATWNFDLDPIWVEQEAKDISKWKQDALWITSKTDGTVFKITPITRSFDLISNGKLVENLTPEQLLKTIENIYNQGSQIAKEIKQIHLNKNTNEKFTQSQK